MPVLKETPEWVENIYGVDVGDPVSGGETGVVNQPLRDLAKRTQYLKGLLSSVSKELASISDLVGGIDVSATLMKDKNLADVTNKATARANLGVATADHKHDSDYLRVAQSLADVPDPLAARLAIGAAAADHTHDALYLFRKMFIGVVFPFATNTLPSDYFIEANGALLSRRDFPELFGVIGTLYGAGDGINTFRIPDYRGCELRGWDHGRGLDPNRAFGSYQADAIKGHTHKYKDRYYTTKSASFEKAEPIPQNYNEHYGSASSDRANTYWLYYDATSESAGGTETCGKNMAVMYGILYR